MGKPGIPFTPESVTRGLHEKKPLLLFAILHRHPLRKELLRIMPLQHQLPITPEDISPYRKRTQGVLYRYNAVRCNNHVRILEVHIILLHKRLDLVWLAMYSRAYCILISLSSLSSSIHLRGNIPDIAVLRSAGSNRIDFPEIIIQHVHWYGDILEYIHWHRYFPAWKPRCFPA